MRQFITALQREISKLRIKEMAFYAMYNMPHIHQPTLKTFLELISVDGNVGLISSKELAEKMTQTLNRVENGRISSLLIVAKLLEVPMGIENFPRLRSQSI